MGNFKENYSKLCEKKKTTFYKTTQIWYFKIGFQQIIKTKKKTICGWESKDWINNNKLFKKQNLKSISKHYLNSILQYYLMVHVKLYHEGLTKPIRQACFFFLIGEKSKWVRRACDAWKMAILPSSTRHPSKR